MVFVYWLLPIKLHKKEQHMYGTSVKSTVWPRKMSVHDMIFAFFFKYLWHISDYTPAGEYLRAHLTQAEAQTQRERYAV